MYVQTCSIPFLSISFLLHEASIYIFQDMTKDLEVSLCQVKCEI